MAARITRAKKKIAVRRIPYRVPPPPELPERIAAVLSVVPPGLHDGHDGAARRRAWCAATSVERSLELCRLLRRLLPRDPSVAGLLAAAAAHRRAARDPHGAGRAAAAARGARTATGGTAPRSRGRLARSARPCAPVHPSSYALQAAIAAGHAESPRVAGHRLARGRRALRRARSGSGPRRWSRSTGPWRSASRRPAAGLTALDALSTSRSWRPTATCRRRGRTCCAGWAGSTKRGRPYAEALLLTENAVERAFLEGRLRASGG
jgi:RNA polymerase sigma-70 factor (ECF subfamily)